MGLLHVGVLLAVVLSTQACKRSGDCGCIVRDDTEIPVHSYITEPLRTEEYQLFLERMHSALVSHWLAYTYIYSFPDDDIEPPEETGSPICPSKQKHILGYFKNHGLTLCAVVKPDIQNVKKAECCSDQPPCGQNTRCVASGLERRRYLVFCDALFFDYDGCLVGADILSETEPAGFDESDFIDGIVKREANEEYSNSTIADEGRFKRAPGCPPHFSYFAFRDDFLPTTCTAKKCNCG